MVVACKLNNYAILVLLNELKVFLIRLVVPHLEGSVARPSIDVTSDDEFTLTILAELILKPLILLFTAVT